MMKKKNKMSTKSSKLFPDGSSDSEVDKKTNSFGTSSAVSSGFKINNNYAQRYDTWRNKEETMKGI